MRMIETRRMIAAEPAAIWAVLTDPARIVAGGLGVLRLDGTIAAGQKIRLESAVAPGRIFTLTVAEASAPQKMVWTSGQTARFGLGPFFIADNKFYILDDEGTLTIIKPSTSKYIQLDQVKVIKDGADAWAPL